MSKFHRIFILMLLVIVTACGGNAGTQPEGAAADGAATASSSPAAAVDTNSAGDKRIVSLSILHTSNLLALGIQPYGAVTQAGKDFLPHAAPLLEGTVNLGNSQEPNLEAIVDAAPDLIIGQDELLKGNRAELEKIAPVYSLPAFGEMTWREQLLELGKETGREQEAHQFMTDYDEKLAKVKANVKQAIGEDTVLVIRVMAKEIRLYGLDRSYGSLLYEDLGLNPVAGLEKFPEGPQAISREVLPEYDADRILLEVAKADEAQALYAELQNSAIWNNMKAVKNGHIYMIEQQPWLDYSALGMLKSLELADSLLTSKE
ncbi:hypothetical protein BBD42_19190 [Paenibacillus sp. BIHB 4019]|uniref:Fe/B12 periplasmic-binding domain-containing protein n=1 Tax=Paenibacillus sp. BIHB 4019 TaxID=1870819 RepID=A0A1B2DKZ1_9BACL|nr:ABC transporter substrate-binding protein [Paenibacillus sp. BIHB 4019]ANY68361.1 hypothetical protein BBD42_19190 [Paenibacillus sp. BIHB 4019]